MLSRRVAQRFGLCDVSMHAAEQLLWQLGFQERAAAPVGLLTLAYPAPSMAAKLQASAQEGVPPRLLLALIRQESAFDPREGSTAVAVGLTQIVAATGAEIAPNLGVPWSSAGRGPV